MVLRIGKKKDDKKRKILKERFADSHMINWGKKIKNKEKKNNRNKQFN